MTTKEIRECREMAKRYGFTLKRSKKHLVFENDKGLKVTAGKTGGWRATREFESNLKRVSKV